MNILKVKGTDSRDLSGMNRFSQHSGVSREAFWNSKSFDSLAYYLATYVNPSMTPGAMKMYLWQQKTTGKRFVEIKEDATLEQKERITSFPLFNLGQFKGGLIVVQKYNRERPFRLLANRTIGYVQGMNDLLSRFIVVFDGDAVCAPAALYFYNCVHRHWLSGAFTIISCRCVKTSYHKQC